MSVQRSGRTRPVLKSLAVVALALGLSVASLGFGGQVADAAAATTTVTGATLTVNAPAQLTTGAAPTQFTATASNPGAAINNARFDFTFTGDPGLTANQVTLQYKQNGAFLPVPLTGTTAGGGSITGSFGPPTGFPFPTGTTNTTVFQISIAAGAPLGTLTSVAKLDAVSPTDGAVVSTVATSNPATTTITAASQANTYAVTGTSTPPSGSATAFGPGSLKATVSSTGFTDGALTLPDINIPNYRLFGVLPTSVQARVVPAAPVTGTISGTTLTVTSSVTLVIDQISVFGVPLLTPGSTCQTVMPSTVTLTGDPGVLQNGGSLSGGTYTAAKFSNCGLFGFFLEPLLNANVSGIPNAITANLAAAGSSAFTLTATTDASNAKITGDNQGFSVESADFAHGYLTKALMAQRLKTLGKHGVIRIGGYSMDLVWPTFGAYRNAPAPAQAIGGVVDQSDLDQLKNLLDATGWTATIGVPLKAVIDQSLIKNLTKDPAPAVAFDQAVAEVKAAHKTLGNDLIAVEVGNEFDNITSMTSAQYYALLTRYQDAIDKAIPGSHIKMVGPSANTSKTNTVLSDFVTAVAGDTTRNPSRTLEELSSHFYPGSHCGTSTLKLPTLMSDTNYTKTQAKLQGIVAAGAPLGNKIPSVVNESNSASCSGQPGVSDAYATSLWSLDYLLQSTQAGISRVEFHTNTAAICGDFQARTSPNYPISYRYYGAFCAANQAALDADQLSASPLYYGIWAFRQVPKGTFVDLNLPDTGLNQLRAYGVKGNDGKLTVVLINVQDPATATSTDDTVALNLPSSYRKGSSIALSSTTAGGLSSTDPSGITLGGRSVSPSGVATGTPTHDRVAVTGKSATLTVAPGTAQIVTFSH